MDLKIIMISGRPTTKNVYIVLTHQKTMTSGGRALRADSKTFNKFSFQKLGDGIVSRCNYARGQKFHLSAWNYESNLERTSNSSQSTRPIGRVLWEELLFLSSFTLKSEGETSLFLSIHCEIFLSVYGMQLLI